MMVYVTSSVGYAATFPKGEGFENLIFCQVL